MMILLYKKVAGIFRSRYCYKSALKWIPAKGQGGLSKWGKHVFIWLQAFIILAVLFALSEASGHDTDLYTIQIDLPAEIIHDVTIIDTLPSGLVYSAGSLKVTGASANMVETIAYPNDGSQPVTITWSFGDLDNSADEDILIQFQVLVADTDQNRDGMILAPSVALLQWRDQKGFAQSSSAKSTAVRIIEPDLQIKQRFMPPSAKIGETVTCTISFCHTPSSHSDAFVAEVTENLPQGLIYTPGSMEIVAGPKGTYDDSNSQKLRWHFDKIDMSWAKTNEIRLRYKATIDKRAKQGSTLNGTADLSWASSVGIYPEKRTYFETASGSISIASTPPAFVITVADYPNPIRPGDELTYAINYKNIGGYAQGAAIQATYDPKVAFISAVPAPDQGSDSQWTLGDLMNGASGTIEVKLGTGSSLADGTLLTSSARIADQDGVSAQDTAITRVMTTAPTLQIEKAASDRFIRPGGALNYTITYSNSGNTEAENVTITDLVDVNLDFDPADATPRASKIWRDAEGTHLWWNASILKSERLSPGGSGKIDIRVGLPPVPEHPQFDWVYNNYKIDSDLSEGKFKTLETAVIHSLYLRKKAETQAYFANEMVNYTIIYGNDLALDADKAVVMDVLPDPEFMEFIEANPQPTAIKNNVLVWALGTIPPKSSGTIKVYLRIKENHSDIQFRSTQSVSGQGYVHFDQRLDTAQKPNSLTNFANITASYLGLPESDESSATIMLADALGTAASIVGHGSGTYSRDEESQFFSKDKTIQMKTSLLERYRASSFSLPQGRYINFDSKWSEVQSAKNRVTGASMIERYTYASRIDRNSTLSLDRNGSILASDTSFEGAGHIGLTKRSNVNIPYPFQGAFTYESHEDYLGSFKVSTKFDEYGKNAESSRSASGVGYAASDKRIGTSQRSYESGTGDYQVEDRIETQTNYLAKDINVSYGPMKYNYTPDFRVPLSQKWSEGMWSRSGTLPITDSSSLEPASFIGEQFSQADYLKKNATAIGLDEMDTEAEFSGRAQFKSQYVKSKDQTRDELSLYDEYAGKYKINRKLSLNGVAAFDEPHLSISKVGSMDPAGGSFINYVLTVVNDGNRALGPVYILDLFPSGTEYVYSSLRPSELASNSAQWTLVNLGIGSSSTIELKLNATEDQDNLVNSVQARGGYNDKWVSAQNYSALQLNWLSCCPPQLRTSKTGYVDVNDSTLVHYRIVLKNRESYIMAATINDDLPGGMMFINSTMQPSDCSSGHVRWNITDLKPNEVKVIEYLVRALQNGVFVNQAQIETTSFNGSDSAFADVSCQVQIGSTSNSGSDSNWKPPACFGLNCTQQEFEKDWMACVSCGAQEPETVPKVDQTCPACSGGSGDDEGYDIP
jgi:uncharacterized repeat protein (TIGR01451 family)